jgi:hypothetical protein
MGKKAQAYIWVYKKKESSEKVVCSTWMIGKHGDKFKLGSMLMFKKRLGLSGTCSL